MKRLPKLWIMILVSASIICLFLLKPLVQSIYSLYHLYPVDNKEKLVINTNKWEQLPDFPNKILITKEIPVDLKEFSIPIDIVVSKNDRHLYVLTYTTLYKLRTDTLTIDKFHRSEYERGKGYLSIALSPDDEFILLYRMPNLVFVLRTFDLSVVRNFELPESDYKTKVAFHPSGKEAYALSDRGALSIIDLEAKRVVENVSVKADAASLAISQTGDQIYITNRTTNHISIFEPTVRKLMDPMVIEEHRPKVITSDFFFIAVGLNAIAVDPSGELLYVQSVGDSNSKNVRGDTIYVVGIQQKAIIKKLAVGLGAARLQFTFGGKYLFAGDKGYEKGKGFTTIIDSQTVTVRYHMRFAFGFDDYVINGRSNRLCAIAYETKPPTLTVFQLLEPK